MRERQYPGNIHSTPDLYRRRVLGGSTTIWGGRCVPLDEIDLEQRDFVPHSGWPFEWAEIKPFYVRAQNYCDAGNFAYTTGETFGPAAPATISDFVSQNILTDRLERFSHPTNFGKRYSNSLASASNLRVILNSPCVQIETDDQDHDVKRLVLSRLDRTRFYARAHSYVLAAGGIETTRLLMTSDSGRRGGLGNESGSLGRYYMCHLENTLGRLRLTPASRPATIDFERAPDGAYVRRKFCLSADTQRHHRLLNSTFRFHYPLIADPSHGHPILSAMYLVKDAILPEYRRKIATIEVAQRNLLKRDWRFYGRHFGNVVTNMPEILRFSQSWIRLRILATRKLPFVVVSSANGTYPLDFNSEQVPNPDSTIKLSDQKDAFGMRKVIIDWRMTEQDVDSVVRTYRLLRELFAASGCAALDIPDASLTDLARASTPVGGHHIGTARMSNQPTDGVVDSDCRVHGLKNLYVSSAAVFPTCGHANPTLTIVALALRLADHLKQKLAVRRDTVRDVYVGAGFT